MTQSVTSAQVGSLTLPLWEYLGVTFFSYRTVVFVSFTCQILREKFRRIANTIEQTERTRMGIVSPGNTRLSLENVIHGWQRLSGNERRAIRIAIDARPLDCYVQFEPATVLLQEAVLSVRNNLFDRHSLVIQERKIDRALILASSLLSGTLLQDALMKLAERKGLSIEDALKIIMNMEKSARSSMLCDLGMREDLSWKTLLEVAMKIDDPEERDAMLEGVAARKNMHWINALEISKKIVNPRGRDASLSRLASRFFNYMDKHKGDFFESVLEISLLIADKDRQINLLANLAYRQSSIGDLETALQIIFQKIPESMQGPLLEQMKSLIGQ